MCSLLKENPNRFVLFPIQYDEIWNYYKKALACFWTAEEVDFKDDWADWQILKEEEKLFIKNILAFFAGSDGIVLENLGKRFINEIQIPEARCFYAFQMAIENIHSETYCLLIDSYIRNPIEKERLFKAIETIPAVSRKAKWALKWSEDKGSNFATRLVAFAAVEGIFFSGSFCAIYWFKQKGLLKGLTFSNELISRDESLHTDFACLIYKMLETKLSEKIIYEIIEEAVNIEKQFICESISCGMLGMNVTLMSQYIEFVADRLILQLGYKKKYNTKNPFNFMELISLENKQNFFEGRNSEYSLASLLTGSNVLEFTSDF